LCGFFFFDKLAKHTLNSKAFTEAFNENASTYKDEPLKPIGGRKKKIQKLKKKIRKFTSK